MNSGHVSEFTSNVSYIIVLATIDDHDLDSLSLVNVVFYFCHFLSFFSYESLKNKNKMPLSNCFPEIRFTQKRWLTLLFEIQTVWIWSRLQPLLLLVGEGSWFKKYSIEISSACNSFSSAISWVPNILGLSLFIPILWVILLRVFARATSGKYPDTISTKQAEWEPVQQEDDGGIVFSFNIID